MNLFFLSSDQISYGADTYPNQGNPESQRIWIREYKLREKSGDEFYFISFDPVNGERLGVFRLYNFRDDFLEQDHGYTSRD